jgi:hypothetical protein
MEWAQLLIFDLPKPRFRELRPFPRLFWLRKRRSQRLFHVVDCQRGSESMRRLSIRQLITSLLVKDFNMSTDMLMDELRKHDVQLSKLVVGHFRSTIREVLLYLVGQGLLDLSRGTRTDLSERHASGEATDD